MAWRNTERPLGNKPERHKGKSDDPDREGDLHEAEAGLVDFGARLAGKQSRAYNALHWPSLTVSTECFTIFQKNFNCGDTLPGGLNEWS